MSDFKECHTLSGNNVFKSAESDNKFFYITYNINIALLAKALAMPYCTVHFYHYLVRSKSHFLNFDHFKSCKILFPYCITRNIILAKYRRVCFCFFRNYLFGAVLYTLSTALTFCGEFAGLAGM